MLIKTWKEGRTGDVPHFVNDIGHDSFIYAVFEIDGEDYDAKVFYDSTKVGKKVYLRGLVVTKMLRQANGGSLGTEFECGSGGE